MTSADLPIVQDLLVQCADYFLMDGGAPPGEGAASAALEAAPAGLPEDARWAFGAFDDESRFVALLTAIRDHPAEGASWIGLLLVDPAHRSKGLGSDLVDAFLVFARVQSCHEIRVTVHDVNDPAARFWARHGFAWEATERREDGLRHVVHTMLRSLAGSD